ncbi:MAG: carboxypeptidase regulatory-like domain-containing protein [Candidatus Koribacter versatilis]|uniref:Carboxypeptidase regulatory-like domain-containing protein n=1 Tax=Candidatus Korobacter versatilis TaxID=658062 RepID=A0A932ABB7_9BACT|nr:carboxypeptidase regulatory-like domain-containing protein [Candidatus Koribacter versatilis]
MKRFIRILALALVATLATGALSAQLFPRPKNNRENQLRTLDGVVMGKGDAPLSGAVVYLKNAKTLAVKSLYSGDDGGYRFNALAPNTDYEVFAEYKGKKSDTKTMSSFDSRPNVRINLHIDSPK